MEKFRYKNNQVAVDKNQVADGYIKKGFPESIPKSLFILLQVLLLRYRNHSDVYP